MTGEIHLRLQPPRSKNQKRRLAAAMRARNKSETEIGRVVWHRDNSPLKHNGLGRKAHYGTR